MALRRGADGLPPCSWRRGHVRESASRHAPLRRCPHAGRSSGRRRRDRQIQRRKPAAANTTIDAPRQMQMCVEKRGIREHRHRRHSEQRRQPRQAPTRAHEHPCTRDDARLYGEVRPRRRADHSYSSRAARVGRRMSVWSSSPKPVSSCTIGNRWPRRVAHRAQLHADGRFIRQRLGAVELYGDILRREAPGERDVRRLDSRVARVALDETERFLPRPEGREPAKHQRRMQHVNAYRRALAPGVARRSRRSSNSDTPRCLSAPAGSLPRKLTGADAWSNTSTYREPISRYQLAVPPRDMTTIR